MQENVGTMLPQIGITTDTVPVKNALTDKIDAKIKKHEKEKQSLTLEAYIAEKENENPKPKESLASSMTDKEIKSELQTAADNASNTSNKNIKDTIVEYYYIRLKVEKSFWNDLSNTNEIKYAKEKLKNVSTKLAELKDTASDELLKEINKIEKSVQETKSKLTDKLKKESENELLYGDYYYEGEETTNEVKVGSLKFKSNVPSTELSEFMNGLTKACKVATKSLAEATKAVGKTLDQLKGEVNLRKLTPFPSNNLITVKGNNATLVITNEQYAYSTAMKDLVEFTKYLHLLRKVYFLAKKEIKIDGISFAITTSKVKTEDGNVKATCILKIVYKTKVPKAAPVNESASIELKRLDEKRAQLEKLQDQLDEVTDKINNSDYNTGDEKRKKGLENHIDKLKKEIEKEEKALEKKNKEEQEKETKESVDELITESKKMDPAIKKIVEEFESKGYLVKYASPGHNKLRKKEDQDSDGVYHGKLYSDARVMFADDYDLPSAAPKYWHWRMVDGKDYLDISPVTYNKEDGTPDEAFKKWRSNYLASLREFAKSLEPAKHRVREEEKKESVEEFDYESYLEKVMEEYDSVDTSISAEEYLMFIESELFGDEI